MITIACLMTKGDWDNLTAHMKMGKKNGITKEEITHLSFYAGWPNAWHAFNIVKQVWD